MLKYPSPDLDLYKALIKAYERCLENKPHVKKTSFHLTFEKTIHGLALEIQNRTYHGQATANEVIQGGSKKQDGG